MLTKAPRGTKDVLPSESYKWQYVENLMREICEFYGYKEIRTPGFEHTELFLRGVGESTDIVRKEMYTFNDRSGRSITLKAEGTSPAVRAFIEHGLYAETQPTKLYYITPVYRYEKPQAGRLREHHQFGVEIFGAKSASADAEVISIAMTLLKKLGLNNLELRINSVGCPVCRKNYNKVLKEFLKEHLDELCDDCKVRYEVNPLRVLDCKVESCRRVTGEAPLITDYLCDDCRNHFEELKKYLDAMGYDYIVDPRIVRGLDYYTKTAFEIISKDIGAQGTVCGGGRYDGLIEECGGPSMPGVGFGMGIERLLLTLEQNGIEIPKPEGPDLFIAYIGDEAKLFTFTLANKLRFNGLKVEIDHMERSLKAQMKYANKLNAKFAVVIGEEELESKKVKLKNMATGEETEILIDEIEKAIKN
ncbi:histidyl-tRNA synthetase [Caldanaerobacter subterraneus subsp. tengcongensis MB4]|uniref:Histidine--tRNA ligase n=1 Tax=Caldanaerobacter subterraneus subsp. tengcongensis (strain DSM 15242 / JCM 11007 / NBRC 100824 / MB4) TaxID=273068 RepID=SYH_CALS4|nr:histidine--tRNA ligase [Caldanaerobacter subterraneus]Q8RAI8.1 RecName: Full=Histidine--tRNA ligase; AltName: Full=Histidyl-tRNA synthetase; Short=HisRS [Caldanaerobacter subterraneus subsp. tengcongensis MB4]AAM24457.1 Histidyl-tRNA synthetase [Caldanaerobacter subterraneus subsp. tengcongensis MB4]MCS3915982.1 histidyl-tRNA synthetase [Caldanaerobacter subterraneus subsp. tengcongensis MB4]